MKRGLFLSLAVVLLALILAVPTLADTATISEWAKAEADKLPEADRVVNVYTWTYYIPDEVVELFEETTGIKINYTPFSEVEEVITKLQMVSGMYDLIVTSDYSIQIMHEAGMLEQIDPSRLPNYENINPTFQGQYYDPDDKFSIPYTNTIPLIVYDPEQVDFEVTGFADLWREEFVGKLAMIDDRRNIIGMAQKLLGFGFEESDPANMELVKEKLMELKPNIAVFNADTPHNALIGGDAVAGYMFGSQIVAAQADMPQLQVVYPAEGLGYGIDCYVIPKDAPHLDATYIFLNFLLDGEISAMGAELINYASCNAAANEFLSETFKNSPAVNPTAEQIAGANMMYPLDAEAQRLYDDLWTEFKK